MTDRQHTPGPWFVDGPPNNQIVWSDEENRVCFLAHSDGRDDGRDIANGRLIAAAPELLAALKAMVLNDPDKYRDCHSIALEVIAKAEGPLYRDRTIQTQKAEDAAWDDARGAMLEADAERRREGRS